MRKLVFYLQIFSCICLSTCEWFSSVSHLEDLVQEDDKLLASFANFLERETARVEKIGNMLSKIKKDSFNGNMDLKLFINNPINQYTILKRMAFDWPNIILVVANMSSSTKMSWLIEQKEDFFPDGDDFRGVMQGLAYLRETYGYPIEEFADGIVGDSTAITPLNSVDCLMVARNAQEKDMHRFAIPWLKESLRRSDKSGTLSVTSAALLALAESFHAVGDKDFAQILMREHLRAKDGLPLGNDIRDIIAYNYKNTRGRFDKKLARLCQAKVPKTREKKVKKLRCFFWNRNSHPYFLLQPFKVEQLWSSPQIVQVHDFVTEGDMRYLIQAAKSKMIRSYVVGTHEQVFSDSRISKNVFLSRSDDTVKKIYDKIADFADLETAAPESLAVGNYGTGGFFAPHTDYFNTNHTQMHYNRLATMLLYLSDVDQGGNTVFYELDLAITPSRGSGIFWFNLLKSGEGDPRTLHSGCPVSTGSKWIANQWIGETVCQSVTPCRSTHCRENRMNFKS